MREIIKHRPGKIFLFVLAISIIGMLYVTKYFTKPILFFGWMTLPFVCGVIFILIWLVAYLIYFFKYWPYR
ncbi:hypothetical protein KAW65_05995 [candidate division WOR-3 bacterium]|nr:hypothetical protein [candidate division WOR-3 bacterium]